MSHPSGINRLSFLAWSAFGGETAYTFA